MSDSRLIVLSGVRECPRRSVAPDAAGCSILPFQSGAGMTEVAKQSERQISADEIANWYTPGEALDYANRSLGSAGGEKALWQLLTAGLIEAASSTTSLFAEGKDKASIKKTPTIIPHEFWKYLSNSESDLWKGGYVTLSFPGQAIRDVRSTIKCFGIRLKTQDVQSHLPKPTPRKGPWIKPNPRPPVAPVVPSTYGLTPRAIPRPCLTKLRKSLTTQR